MRIFKYILMCVMATVLVASCDDDSEGFKYGDFNYDMVTYSGEYDSQSVFTFQSYDDSPLITLTASNLSNPEMKVGQRLLLNYIVDKDFGDNHKAITVNGYSKITTDTILILPQEVIDTLKRDKVKLRSVWRTGNYLNVRCDVQYTEKARRLFLASTGEPDESGLVQAYQIQDLMDAPTYYWFGTYFSYYIAPVWENVECKAFRFNIEDLTYPDVKYYDFLKEK